MPKPGRSLQRVIASFALLVGSAFLGFRASEGIEETRGLVQPASLAGASYAYDQLECLEHEFDRLVPSGRTVFLDPAIPAQWRQLALNFAFPDRRVTFVPEQADVLFALRVPSPVDACGPDAFVVTGPEPSS